MEVMLNGIRNFLEIINENWTTIMVIIGLAVGICKKAKSYMNKSDEEKLNITKKQIHEIALQLVTEAENDYDRWDKAGSIKRSQVVEKLYKNYPILSKFAGQQELLNWIDSELDNALVELKKVIDENKK